MGLTIHYKLQAKGRAQDAKEMIEKMRQKALDWSFEEVSEVAHFVGDECDYQKRDRDDEWFWALIQAQTSVSLGPLRSAHAMPVEAVILRTWPGEGCEEANFGLCRYPKYLTFGEQSYKVPANGWSWHSFCKTQYANEKGPMNFVKCHTLVVAMLDYAKELGILAEVHDEGDFWEKRDLEALVDEVSRWDVFISGMSALLNEIAPGQIEAPIMNRPDYEAMAILGMQHLDPAILAKLNDIAERR